MPASWRTDCHAAGSRSAGWGIRAAARVTVPQRACSRERDLPAAFFDKKKGMITPAFTKYALPLLGKNLPSFASF